MNLLDLSFIIICSFLFIIVGVKWFFEDLLVGGIIMILTGIFFIGISLLYSKTHPKPLPSPNSP